jgi:anti-sigma factor RsiW
MSETQCDDERAGALMHAVLDGESSPEQRAELDRLLAADPATREKFAGLRALFGAMSQVPPIDPPVHLLDGVIGQFDAIRKNYAVTRQLSERQRVLDSKTRKLQARSHPTNRITKLIQSLMEHVMEKPSFISTTKGKLVIGAGAAAAVAVIVLFGVSNTATTDKDAVGTLGTVVPAERYRAAQSGADDVRPTDNSTIQPTTMDGAANQVASHEVAAHDVAAHEVAAHEVAAHEVAAHEVAAHEVAAHEVAAHEVAAHEVAAHEVAAHEVAAHDSPQ